MRAVVQRTFGPPEVLVVEEVPDPVPGPGQVLIDVRAASVVFIETTVRAGTGIGADPRFRPELPRVPGNGVGGVVAAVGEGVDPAMVGTAVVSTTGGSGGYAERVAVDAAEPLPVPAGVPLADAVALLADGRTAVGLADAARPAAGEWVLVEAAGGGVGSLLVQLAVAAGARVAGLASGPAKLAVAERAGATVTVDYTREDWPARVRAATGSAGDGPVSIAAERGAERVRSRLTDWTGVDVVFDGVGGAVGAAALELVADGGRFVVHGAAGGPMTVPGEDEVRRRGLTVIGLDAVAPNPGDIRVLAARALELAAAGTLRPTVGQTFPLAEAAAAHAAIEARRAVGKTLLVP